MNNKMVPSYDKLFYRIQTSSSKKSAVVEDVSNQVSDRETKISNIGCL